MSKTHMGERLTYRAVRRVLLRACRRGRVSETDAVNNGLCIPGASDEPPSSKRTTAGSIDGRESR